MSSPRPQHHLDPAIAAVKSFQEKIGSVSGTLRTHLTQPGEISDVIKEARNYCSTVSVVLRICGRHFPSTAGLRTQLLLEELSEVLEALQEGDEVKLADGLADLLYVVIGTATTYSLPLGQLFDEVHRSNMSKSKAAASHDGSKGKDEGYSAPRIAEVLRAHYESQV